MDEDFDREIYVDDNYVNSNHYNEDAYIDSYSQIFEYFVLNHHKGYPLTIFHHLLASLELLLLTHQSQVPSLVFLSLYLPLYLVVDQ